MVHNERRGPPLEAVTVSGRGRGEANGGFDRLLCRMMIRTPFRDDIHGHDDDVWRAMTTRRSRRGFVASVVSCLVTVLLPRVTAAQELIPAAYTPAPYGVRLVSLSSSYSSGKLNFEPSAPIEDASARVSANTLSYATTFNFAGRSANVTLGLPFVIGDVEGKYLGEPAEARRNGFADAGVRFGVNLIGAPAMNRQEFAERKPETMIGASFSLRVPTGQYEREQLLNIGTNRWAFKPEIGLVQPFGRVAIDLYVGGWFFTTNPDFLGGNKRSQKPILSTELHVRYRIQPSIWFSLDGNFWRGGRTTVGAARTTTFSESPASEAPSSSDWGEGTRCAWLAASGR